MKEETERIRKEAPRKAEYPRGQARKRSEAVKREQEERGFSG